MLKSVAYKAPAWAASLEHAPTKKLTLGHFPTPIMPFEPPGLPDGVRMFIKRDDFSGLESSGNKVRKLEFLLQAALDANADCVVTGGGIQSNHARVTAVLARWLGLDSHLLLMASRSDVDPGLNGNLLLDRLVGANIIQFCLDDLKQMGGDIMSASVVGLAKTCDDLRAQGRRPYNIPVGGSCGLGSWGYLQAIEEIRGQLEEMNVEITDLAFACGSGGTAAGLGLGAHLQATNDSRPMLPRKDGKFSVHAYSVSEQADAFHRIIDDMILPEMGAPASLSSREFLTISQAQGLGYSISKEDELQFITDVARKTGVVVDPVYSGKALYRLMQELRETPEKFVGKSILFVHTGGQFGLFAKLDQMHMLQDQVPVQTFHYSN